MIFNMSAGGGSAEIKVINVASVSGLPSAKDGTIAIVSATAAGEVYVQGTEPASPASGDVWILVDASGDNIITLGNVQVYPMQAQQYLNGAWTEVSGFLRMNGEWSELAYPSVYLYNRGDQCTDITSGWAANKWGGNYTFNTDNIYLTVSNGGNQPSAVQTKQPIDVTKYKTLRFIGNVPGNGTGQVTFGLLPSYLVSTTTPDTMLNGFAAKWQNQIGGGSINKTLDISSYSGEYYVGLFTRENIYIYEFILEG